MGKKEEGAARQLEMRKTQRRLMEGVKEDMQRIGVTEDDAGIG